MAYVRFVLLVCKGRPTGRAHMRMRLSRYPVRYTGYLYIWEHFKWKGRLLVGSYSVAGRPVMNIVPSARKVPLTDGVLFRGRPAGHEYST